LSKAETYLQKLCLEIPSRRVGSAGNRAATDFFAGVVKSFDFETQSPAFDCLDWQSEGVSLTVGDTLFEAFASPYSLGCRVSAPLVVVATVEALAAAQLSNAIVLLRGDIAREQLMPKNFAFYNPDEHKRIVQLLEAKKPRAIVAATSRNPEMAGALYPFPLIEDGDFDIPSVYMTDREGDRLAEYAGQQVALESQASRIPAQGCNVIARKGGAAQRRVALVAHIDTKIGTPGALDNASGVAVLLLLAELLADYSGQLGIEMIAMNGEDYYASPGELQYLASNAGRFGEIVLGINLDGVGYCQGRVAYSLYGCPADMTAAIRQVFSACEDLVEGEAWYQGDHALFLMNQRPTLAITSERVAELVAQITHSPQDRPEVVDSARLVSVALALRELLLRLEGG